MAVNNMNIHWPNIELPDGFENAESYLRHLVEKGAMRKYGNISQQVRARIEYELHDLNGFEPYFIILHDIVELSKANKICISASNRCVASSIVNYCLGITPADPIKWGLPFERFFLKTEMDFPHVELEVDMFRKQTLINCIKEKYGNGYVSKVYNAYKKNYYDKSYEAPERFAVTNDDVFFFFDEPFEENIGKISAYDCPAQGMIDVPKYSKDILEELGYMYIKIGDIFSSESILPDIENETGLSINLEDVPLDDNETFNNLRYDNPESDFDFNWSMFYDEVKHFYDINLWDVCNIRAIYIFDDLKTYIERKTNEKEYEEEYPESSILKHTFGLLLYQEQIVEILHIVAGMNYKEAEQTRRNLCSRDNKRIDSSTEEIFRRCRKQGMADMATTHIINLILANMNIASDLSSIICTSIATYQDAWLRLHFPNQHKRMMDKFRNDIFCEE